MNSQLPRSTSPSAGYGDSSITWEYKSLVIEGKKIHDPKTMEPLNELGAQGWELVNAMPANAVVREILYTFKRPRPRGR